MVEGRSLGLRASEPTFYFDNQSSNPSEVTGHFLLNWMIENNEKRLGLAH